MNMNVFMVSPPKRAPAKKERLFAIVAKIGGRFGWFDNKLTVHFGDSLNVGQPRTRNLVIENPLEETVQVSITKYPKKWFTVRADNFELEGNSKAIIEVVCDPPEGGSHSEILKIVTSYNRCELSVILTAKSIPQKAGVKKTAITNKKTVPQKTVQKNLTMPRSPNFTKARKLVETEIEQGQQLQFQKTFSVQHHLVDNNVHVQNSNISTPLTELTPMTNPTLFEDRLNSFALDFTPEKCNVKKQLFQPTCTTNKESMDDENKENQKQESFSSPSWNAEEFSTSLFECSELDETLKEVLNFNEAQNNGNIDLNGNGDAQSNEKLDTSTSSSVVITNSTSSSVFNPPTQDCFTLDKPVDHNATFLTDASSALTAHRDEEFSNKRSELQSVVNSEKWANSCQKITEAVNTGKVSLIHNIESRCLMKHLLKLFDSYPHCWLWSASMEFFGSSSDTKMGSINDIIFPLSRLHVFDLNSDSTSCSFIEALLKTLLAMDFAGAQKIDAAIASLNGKLILCDPEVLKSLR